MFRRLADVDVRGRRVLVRVDFNVPLDGVGNVSDDERIRASIPTIRALLDGGASKVILMSHLGRPDGRVVEGLRMARVAERLERLIGIKVVKLDECVGRAVSSAISSSSEKVFLLENLRFYPEEERNDKDFAGQLASLADIYVNDAFGASHRAHASVAAVASFLPSCAGLLLEKELDALSSLLNPERPFVAVLGGAKVSDKVGVIGNLCSRADKVLVGGAMAFTFLKSMGGSIGKSKVENDKLDMARSLSSPKIVLPSDFVVASGPESSDVSVAPAMSIPESMMGLDIGPESVACFVSELKAARTIVWNGPLGMFEKELFAKGTLEVGRAIAISRATTVVGGGDTLAAIEKFGLAGFSHVSTGGGAMLEFLEGKKLPAVEALERAAINQ
ncbi:phosphoglycerate kinase [Candidatus Woesearchaeota archaeon]|nr:phosphoglycerate kinase [Candidatus Woesearchaeota archaeon]